MTMTSNTQTYLQDLGIERSVTGLALLKELQSRHIARYTFNSLAVVLGQEIAVDSESVFNKIVAQGHGGYCFEHNKLVFDILQDMEFDVRIVLARVVFSNPGADMPRTHRMTLVSLEDGDYIVDTGFGHFTARYPLKLEVGLEQDQGDGLYRIARSEDGDYCCQVLKDGDFMTLYTFDLNRYTEADCRSGNFYSYRHPDAVFVNNLVVCRNLRNDNLSLRNGEFHRIRNGETEITRINTERELHQILTQVFELNVDLPVAAYLFDRFIVNKRV